MANAPLINLINNISQKSKTLKPTQFGNHLTKSKLNIEFVNGQNITTHQKQVQIKLQTNCNDTNSDKIQHTNKN